MGKKPRIKDFEQGFVKCDSCSAELIIEGMELEMVDCGECGATNFIPHRIHDFWLYHPLGGGGMGAVYKAIDVDGKHEYAVKVLPREMVDDEELIDTLLTEGEIAEALGEHPNIISVHDYGDDGQEVFMATEFVDGDRLDVLVKSEGRLSEKKALDIILQLIEAEKHVVECGYLFRDMKPENVMIEPNGTVRLFDYGLCQPLEEAQNPDPNSKLEGSPFYLPPERIVGASEGEYSEVYSLGMVLFYMLTGRTYYSEAEIAELVKKHVSSLRVSSVGTHLRHLDPNTIKVIDTMIARTPNKRFPDFDSLKAAIEPIYDGLESGKEDRQEDIHEGTLPVAEKKSQKKRMAVLLTVLVISAIGVGSFFGYRFYDQMQRKQAAMERVSKELGIPIDVKAPAKTIQELRTLVDARTEEVLKEQGTPEFKFDERAEKAALAKKLGIKNAYRKKVSLDDVKKQVAAEKKAALKKAEADAKTPFSRKAAEATLAKSMGIKLPVPPPKVPANKLLSQYRKTIMDQVKEKYPSKELSKQTMEVMRKYRAHQIGDKVTLQDAVGMTVTGIFKGREGNKLVIDERKILINDLPKAVSDQFNDAVCRQKITRITAALKEDFEKKRLAYRNELVKQNDEAKFFASQGYAKLGDKWVPVAEVVKAKVDAAEKSHAADQRKRLSQLKKKVNQQYTADKMYPHYGYRKSGKKWVWELEALEKKLEQRKKEARRDYDKKVAVVRDKAKKQAEEQIYKANGYVKANNNWIAAKVLFDNRVRMAMIEAEGE